MKRIAFVGEAWGADERDASERAGSPRPFVGGAGRLFNALLASIGIERSIERVNGETTIHQPKEILVTNVFNEQPPRNDVKALMGPRKGSDSDWPALDRGKYLPPSRRPELDRLLRELRDFRPDLIVALGNTPLWALTKTTGIMARRGCWHEAQIGARRVGVIPTIHPAFILRKYARFPLAMSDFQKARAYLAGSLKPATCSYIAEPTMSDVRRLLRLHGPIVFDIETIPKFKAITCVGIADRSFGCCVPFVDVSKPGRNYWPTERAEREAWGIIRRVLGNPKTVKVAQNGAYDITWLREIAGIEVRGMTWDTRSMHHALWPELPHDLGAITTSWPDVLFPPWKAIYKAEKKDD